MFLFLLKSSTAAAGGFVVFLLSMPVIQGQNGWGVTYSSTEICALKGSTVEISCTYRYPSTENAVRVEQVIWFTGGTFRKHVDLRWESSYAGRVQYICVNNNCTLRITDLRESDSAEYKFRFITNQTGGSYTGSPGVNLMVTDLQVSFIRTMLKCHSSCVPDISSYIWYKNGQKIQEGKSSYSGHTYPTDSYSCALKGREDFPSPPVCVYSQSCNRVTHIVRSICVFKGSSVDISCMYNSHEPVTSKFWFSPERSHQWQSPSRPEDLSEDSQFAGRVQVLETERGRSTLRITDLTESDSAQYHFKFTTEGFEWNSSLPATTLTVTDPDVQVLVRPLDSSSAVLQCHSSCLPDRSSYIWYISGQLLWKTTSSFYSVNTNPVNSYSCAFRGHEDFPSPSVCVDGQSCVRVIYSDRIICASKGSSVNISCAYGSHNLDVESKFWFSPERSHQWQSPLRPEDLSEDSQFAGRVQVLESERGRSTLRISDLTQSDSAQYHFKFKTISFEWRSILPGTTLTVTALQVQVTRITVHQSDTEAELKCHSSCSPAGRLSYVWFKNGQKVMKEESSVYKDRFDPGDNISCALMGHETYASPLLYSLRVPSVSVSPSAEIVEGSSVTLTCSSDANPAAKYTWYKKNEEPDLQPLSKDPQLVFSSIHSSDSGEYYCTAENELGRRTSEYIYINVTYAPKRISVSVSSSAEIVEGSSVNLTCSSDANPAANYTWYKEKQEVFQGPEGIYHFSSISSEDRGNYSCKSENQHGRMGSESVLIDVQYAPKLPSVSVSPSAEIVEGSSVTLTCSSDANPAANYTLYKENEDSPKASGQIFTISEFRAEHSGNYYCEVQNRRGRSKTTVHLTVAGTWRSTAAGTTTVLILAVILLSVFLWIRKKKTSKQSSEPGERADNRQQRRLYHSQDDLHYASVQFTRKPTNSLYTKVLPAPPDRHEEEEDMSVEYTAVKFNRGSNDPRNQKSTEEDSDPLYSTINKLR